MPELPEVETVRRGLERTLKLSDQSIEIQDVVCFRKNLRTDLPRPQLLKKLEGEHIVSIHRRAKYLLFETDRMFFLSHLGMTGAWRWVAGMKDAKHFRSIKQTHDHIYIQFAEGALVYNDPRRFGIFDILKISSKPKEELASVYSHSPYFQHLGPEPWDEDFSSKVLLEKAKGKEVAVKNFIMNQEIVVGIGNIYASEALFRAAVRPQRKVKTLKQEEWQRIVQESQAVLQEAILKGGSTISDFAHIDEGHGYFQHSFKVYGREGESCVSCSGKVQNTVLGGRSSYWCRNCQK